MEKLLAKFNYKGDKRICVQAADDTFIKSMLDLLPDVKIDQSIDPRFLYGFTMIFVNTIDEIDATSHKAIHNLYEDGILWYAFPKETPDTSDEAPTRKRGWNSCKAAGFEPVRHICIDDNRSATRFRNKKFISRKRK